MSADVQTIVTCSAPECRARVTLEGVKTTIASLTSPLLEQRWACLETGGPDSPYTFCTRHSMELLGLFGGAAGSVTPDRESIEDMGTRLVDEFKAEMTRIFPRTSPHLRPQFGGLVDAMFGQEPKP